MVTDTLSILFFGQLTDLTGCSRTDLPRVSDTDELRLRLLDRYPGLGQATYVLTVNQTVVQENTTLDGRPEIALLPPFSGG